MHVLSTPIPRGSASHPRLSDHGKSLHCANTCRQHSTNKGSYHHPVRLERLETAEELQCYPRQCRRLPGHCEGIPLQEKHHGNPCRQCRPYHSTKLAIEKRTQGLEELPQEGCHHSKP